MLKRIALFLATNLAVLVLLGIVLSVLQGFGINLGNNASLLVFAAVFGFGGSFFSLLISKWVAKRATGIRLIEAPAQGEQDQWLLTTVKSQADKVGIKMPEVGVFDAPEINAFATGPSRNNALVAVSSGMLRSMNRDEIEAVLGHEVSHVANGDMVTMTLIQGVMNTFVIFLSRRVASLIGGDNRGVGYFATVFLLDIVFGLFASMITMWFSRHREFRADAGGASLAGRDKMIAALQSLAKNNGQNNLPSEMAAFGISGNLKSGLARLVMSHPPLEERIWALKAGQ